MCPRRHRRARGSINRQHAPDRLPGDLAGQIPQGNVKRPTAAVVELQICQVAVVLLESQRVLAEKESEMLLEPEHVVAGSVSDMAVIALDANDHRFKTSARTGVPARPKRRIKLNAMTTDLDASDFHGGNSRGETTANRRQECRRRVRKAIVGWLQTSAAGPSKVYVLATCSSRRPIYACELHD